MKSQHYDSIKLNLISHICLFTVLYLSLDFWWSVVLLITINLLEPIFKDGSTKKESINRQVKSNIQRRRYCLATQRSQVLSKKKYIRNFNHTEIDEKQKMFFSGNEKQNRNNNGRLPNQGEAKPTLVSLIHRKTYEKKENFHPNTQQPLVAVVKNNMSIRRSSMQDSILKAPLYNNYRSPMGNGPLVTNKLQRSFQSPFNQFTGSPNSSRYSPFPAHDYNKSNVFNDGLDIHGSYLVNKSLLSANTEQEEQFSLVNKNFASSSSVTKIKQYEDSKDFARTFEDNEIDTTSKDVVVSILKEKSKRKRSYITQSPASKLKKIKFDDEMDTTLADLFPSASASVTPLHKRIACIRASKKRVVSVDTEESDEETASVSKVRKKSMPSKFGLTEKQTNDLMCDEQLKYINTSEHLQQVVAKSNAPIPLPERSSICNSTMNEFYNEKHASSKASLESDNSAKLNTSTTTTVVNKSLLNVSLKNMKSPFKRIIPESFTPSSAEKLRKHPVYFTAKLDIDEIQKNREEYGNKGVSLQSYRKEQQAAVRRASELLDGDGVDFTIQPTGVPTAASALSASNTKPPPAYLASTDLSIPTVNVIPSSSPTSTVAGSGFMFPTMSTATPQQPTLLVPGTNVSTAPSVNSSFTTSSSNAPTAGTNGPAITGLISTPLSSSHGTISSVSLTFGSTTAGTPVVASSKNVSFGISASVNTTPNAFNTISTQPNITTNATQLSAPGGFQLSTNHSAATTASSAVSSIPAPVSFGAVNAVTTSVTPQVQFSFGGSKQSPNKVLGNSISSVSVSAAPSSIAFNNTGSSGMFSTTTAQAVSSTAPNSIPAFNSASVFGNVTSVSSNVFGISEVKASSANMFGSSTSTGSSASFLSATNTATSLASVFGNTVSVAPSTNVFGNTASVAPPTNVFGNAVSVASSANIFGNTASVAPPANVFGNVTSVASSSNVFGNTVSVASANVFGAGKPQLANSGSVFGTPAVTTSFGAGGFGEKTIGGGANMFGNPVSSNTSNNAFGSTVAPSSSGLFGAPSAASVAPSKSGLFGAPSTASVAPSIFGNHAAVSSASIFGAAAKPAGFAFPATTQTSFASTTNVTQNFGAGNQTAANVFGQPTQNSVFGAANTQTAAAASSNVFGGTTAPALNVFGASSNAAPTSASVFSSQPAKSVGFQFGSSNTAAAQPTGFNFGAPASQASVFGSVNANPFVATTQNAAPSIFGVPTSSVAPATFGMANSTSIFNNTNVNPFGQAVQPTQQASGGFDFSSSLKQQAPSFNFAGAAPAATNAFNVQPSKPSFNFAAQSAPTPSFGAAPNTPSSFGTPQQQNQFGGGGGITTPNFGAQTPTGGGGFSMGTTSTQPVNRPTTRARRRLKR